MNNINSLQTNPIEITQANNKVDILTQKSFSSITGVLSFYTLKSFSKTPILENIMAKGVLKEDGNFIIYFNSKEFINVSPNIREDLKYKYRFSFVLFPDTLFFNGSLMDGFNYNHLSEDISTFIVNGDILPFNKANRASSIGKLKKIEDVIHLNSSLSITYINNSLIKHKKESKSSLIGVDISMQFKKGAT